MDRRTIIAISISAVIFLGYILISNVFFPQKKKPVTPTETITVPKQEDEIKASTVKAVALDKEPKEETKIIHTKIFDVTFSNKGAVVTSIKLNNADVDPDNKSADDSIEMVVEKGKTAEEFPFAIQFGTYKTAAVNDLFIMREFDGNKIEFSRDFEIDGKKVKVKKIFEVVPDQYILKLSVNIENADRDYIPFDFDGVLYTLSIGPQIGPAFIGDAPNDQTDYRKFVYLNNGGRNEQALRRGDKPVTVNGVFSWTAVMGKYYALIASTDASIKDLVFDAREMKTQSLRSAMYFERKKEKTQALTDEYTFFVGPKKREILSLYKDKNYSEIMPVFFLFGTIAEVLKYPLDFFSQVGNYGVAIIFLTILIKILLFPLTKKSFNSMRKMQAVNPKLQELRTRYKDDPKRLNQEMAELYRREGISPLGGCLPQLLQLPIMYALYILFSEYFALKDAVFIPGWINDLSSPESIATLPFAIPFLGADIRLLPIIMLVTQLLSTFFTQGQTAGGDSKMKFLPYILMGVFFFILYNLPSGLVLYWTVQNILTVLQMVVQKYLSDRKSTMKALKA